MQTILLSLVHSDLIFRQIVIRVFEMDSYGKELVRGYGAVHVPLEPGSHTAKVENPFFLPCGKFEIMNTSVDLS